MGRAMKDQTQNLGERTLADIGLEQFATYLMNRIMARYNAGLSDKVRSLGLNTAKTRALAVLSVIDTPTITELAAYAVIEKSALSRALDALEAAGHVARRIDDQDSRTYRIRITNLGRKTFQDVWPDMLAAHDALFDGIDDQERHAFIGTLNKILHNTHTRDRHG